MTAPPPRPSSSTIDNDTVRQRVREGYAAIARAGAWTGPSPTTATQPGSCCGGTGCGGATVESAAAETAVAETQGPGGCCGGGPAGADDIARAVGYSDSELGTVPEGANMGLSCGNPTALASLKPGEVVLDLGAGGGFDVFIAGPRVGSSGRVIGVDMTPDMVSKARRSTASYREQTSLENVEFRLGEIENLPVADASVDVVISNCVINLSPDKPRVWREIARVLKPGGRVAISDLALVQPLPAGVVQMVEALVGCVAGASLLGDIELMARAAGLADVRLDMKGGYIDSMTSFQDPLYAAIMAELPRGSKPGDYITSLNISARKPR